MTDKLIRAVEALARYSPFVNGTAFMGMLKKKAEKQYGPEYSPDSYGEYILASDLAALLAEAQPEEPGLREIRLAVEAMRALAKSIHARVPGESQSEDDSREIVSIADRALKLIALAAHNNLATGLTKVGEKSTLSHERSKSEESGILQEVQGVSPRTITDEVSGIQEESQRGVSDREDKMEEGTSGQSKGRAYSTEKDSLERQMRDLRGEGNGEASRGLLKTFGSDPRLQRLPLENRSYEVSTAPQARPAEDGLREAGRIMSGLLLIIAGGHVGYAGKHPDIEAAEQFLATLARGKPGGLGEWRGPEVEP